MSIRTFNGCGRNGRGARTLAATLVLALVLQPLAVTAARQDPPPAGQRDPFQPFVPPAAGAPLQAEIAAYNKRLYDELIQVAGTVEGPRIIDDVTYPTYTIAGMVLTSKAYVRQLMSFVSDLSDLAKLTRAQKVARITRMMAHAAEAQRWNALARSVYSNANVRMGNTTVGRATYRLIDAELAAAKARGDVATAAFLEHARTLTHDAMAQAFDQRRLQAQDQDPLLSVNFFWRELAEGGDPASFIDEFDATTRAAIDQGHAEISRVRDISTVEGYAEFLEDKYSRTRAEAAGLLGEHSMKLIASLQDFAAAHESLRGTQQQVEQLEIALIVGGIAVVAIFVAPAAALAGSAYVPAAEVGAAGLAVLGAGVQLVHDGQRLYAIQTELTNTEAGQGVLGAAAVDALRQQRSTAAVGLLLDTAFAALSVAQFKAARTALQEARIAREAEHALANAVPAGAAAVTHEVTDAAGILKRIDTAALKAHIRVADAVDPAFFTKAGLAPRHTVQIGGQTFHLSTPFNGVGGRATIIAFQETGAGTVIPRTFYMSGEHGVWRAATGYSGFEQLVLKGPRQSNGRFVNESAADIAAELQGPLSRWASEQPMITLADDAAHRAAYGHLEGGHVGKEFGALVDEADALGTLPRTPGAAPNFTAGPLDRWTYVHPEYGLVEGFTYASHDGGVIYVVLRDARGRVFVPSIQQGEATVTGFGTRAGAIKSDLTVPPLARGRGAYVDNPNFGNDLTNLFHGHLPPALPGTSALPGTAAAAGGAANPAAINALASAHPAVQRGAQRALELGATTDDVNAMLRIAANPDPRVGLEAGKALAQVGQLDDLMAVARRAGVPQTEIDAMLQTARAGGVIGLADMPVALLRAAANQQRVPILVDTAWDIVDRTGKVVVADAPGSRVLQFFRDTLPENLLRTDLVALFNLRANLSFLKNGRAVALTPDEVALLQRVVAHPDAARMYAFISDERVLLRVFDEDLLATGRRYLNAPSAPAVGAATPAAVPAGTDIVTEALPGGLLVLTGRDADAAMQRQIDRAVSTGAPAPPQSTPAGPVPPPTASEPLPAVTPAAPRQVGSLHTLPGTTPLAGDYADGSLGSVRFALDDALTAAGFDMSGSFRTNAADGTVTYEDGEVKVTGRSRDGHLVIDTALADGTAVSTGQTGQPDVDPIEFEILPGAEPEDETALHLDEPDDFVSLNDPSLMTVGSDPTTQAMIAILDDGGGALTVEPADGRAPSMLSAMARRLTGALAVLLPGRRGVLASTAAFSSRTEPVRELWLAPMSVGGRRQASQPIRIVMTSLGTSTGEAFEIQVINDGPEPVRLSGSLVLQPIAKEAQAAVQRQLQRALPRGAMTARLNAYCLEFLRQPPGPGALFRIAPPGMQKQFGAMRGVLDASRRLRDAGVLQPDSEPKAYFHAIRQWAIWTKAQQFTRDGFARAFVDHTRKNIQAAGRPWSQQLEQALRGVVPGRWRDITRVLAEVDAAVGGGNAQR